MGAPGVRSAGNRRKGRILTVRTPGRGRDAGIAIASSLRQGEIDMSRLLCTLLTVAALAAGIATIPATAHAQPAARAYAPEDLRSLSYQDQVRVISLEYSEQSRGRRIPDDQLRFYLDQVNRSNWTFSRIKQDIATSLGGGSAWTPGPPHGGGNSIRCESDRNRPQSCATPWRGPSRLLRQLSDTRCIEGQNWTSTPGRVDVTAGCRAEFGPGQGWGGGGREIRCESLNSRLRECAIPGGAGVHLVRQLSNTPCIEGSTWGTRGSVLWVNHGCRAIFAAGGHGGGAGDYSVSCASNNNREHTCAWDNRRGRPYLQQQLSASPCREGSSWGHRGNMIWVNHGCRGLFGAR
jgi:hypothetical protein